MFWASEQFAGELIREHKVTLIRRGNRTIRRSWEVASEYVDKGFSGAKASRPALDHLKAEARQRRFDAVIVWKLDRWGRSLIDCINGVRELAALGIRWISVTQGLDTTSRTRPRGLCLT
jgi:DNA invertase Pin-like site-specific DNA recombinase